MRGKRLLRPLVLADDRTHRTLLVARLVGWNEGILADATSQEKVLKNLITSPLLDRNVYSMAEKRKSLKVDRKQFEGIVKNLLDSKPMKREKVKVSKKKPHKLIPPQK